MSFFYATQFMELISMVSESLRVSARIQTLDAAGCNAGETPGNNSSKTRLRPKDPKQISHK